MSSYLGNLYISIQHLCKIPLAFKVLSLYLKSCKVCQLSVRCLGHEAVMYCDNGLSAYLGYQVSEGHEKRVAREGGRGLDPREGWTASKGRDCASSCIHGIHWHFIKEEGMVQFTKLVLCARPHAIQCNPLIPLTLMATKALPSLSPLYSQRN